MGALTLVHTGKSNMLISELSGWNGREHCAEKAWFGLVHSGSQSDHDVVILIIIQLQSCMLYMHVKIARVT